MIVFILLSQSLFCNFSIVVLVVLKIHVLTLFKIRKFLLDVVLCITVTQYYQPILYGDENTLSCLIGAHAHSSATLQALI